jgi:glycosyl-4,4'-diaponeurosporenoate acyltransferase
VGIIKRIILGYFRPKAFEFYGDSTVYNLFGIKFYKKYLPTTGDLIRRLRKIKQIDIGKTEIIQELYRYERKTRTYEWRHLIGAVVFVVLTFFIERKLTIFDWIFITFLNLVINIYPIFLQRYNRIRIVNILKRNGYSDPYSQI